MKGRTASGIPNLPTPVVLRDPTDDRALREFPVRRYHGGDGLSFPLEMIECLNSFILDLYDSALRKGIGDFELSWLDRLSTVINFDSAWTGSASITANGPIVHSSFLYRLDPSFLTSWAAVRDCDPLGEPGQHGQGDVVSATVLDPTLDHRFRTWAAAQGCAHLACISVPDPSLGLSCFLSVYRSRIDQAFFSEELRRIELIGPHLASAVRLNRAFHLDDRTSREDRLVARAICDSHGHIHEMDPVFSRLLRLEWPDFDDKKLPSELNAHFDANHDQFWLGQRLRVTFKVLSALRLVNVEMRSLFDQLTPREMMVIRHFGEGKSYKEVARLIGISPTTVRHYLRAAYRKLGVTNKGQLATRLRKSEQGSIV